MTFLFRYKLPTTRRWYMRHKLATHLAFAGLVGTFIGWMLGIAWAYVLLN